MNSDADHEKRPEQILAVHGDHGQAPDQNQVENDQNHRAEDPQLLCNDREDHIVLGLRDELLLHALSQPLAEESPGADGVEGLHDLVSLVGRVQLRMQPDPDSGQTIGSAEDNSGRPKAESDQSRVEEGPALPACDQKHEKYDPDNDNGCGHILL